MESYELNYDNINPFKLKPDQLRHHWAANSRKAVLEHEKFKQIFAEYADAIKIHEKFSCTEWEEAEKLVEKVK